MSLMPSLLLGGLALSATASQSVSEPAATPVKRPNILFIFSDDHGSQAISAYNPTLLATPNIDRIANEGIRFQNAFCTNAICAPSRAVVLSGKYSHLNGVKTWDGFNGSKQATLPKVLQENGYYTALIGKWHLTNLPVGFDDWKILIGQGEYYNPRFLSRKADMKPGTEDGSKPAGSNALHSRIQGYATDVITDEAFQMLDSRPKDKPFFMCLWHKAPHRTWSRGPHEKEMFKDQDLPVPPTLFDDYSTRRYAKSAEMRMTDFRPDYDIKTPTPFPYKPFQGGTDKNQIYWLYQQYIKDYLACIKSLDDNVGRTLKYLEDHGLLENTLVVYSADQGFFLGENSWFDKRWIYDTSMRMPLVMRLPGTVKSGTVCSDIVNNADFAPTFLELAGVKKPDEMQGRSFVPMLKGETPMNWRQSHYYRYYDPAEHHVEPHFGIRTQDYTFVHFPRAKDGYTELFDLRKDPYQLTNVSEKNEYAAVKAELEKQLKALKAELKDDE